MSIKSIALFAILFICSAGHAQYDIEKTENEESEGIFIDRNAKLIAALKKNTHVGSGLNLLLGNQLFLNASPQIGYAFLPNFSAGILGSIQYRRIFNFTETALGSGIFARYVLLRRVIFETSLNFYRIRLSVVGQTSPPQIRSRGWLAGIGYARPLGENSYAHFLVSYDLLQDENNPELPLLDLPNFRLYSKFGLTFYPFR